MRRNLKIVAYLVLVYAIYQLIPVIQVGHWNNVAKEGGQINQGTYSLGFGYRTVMCSIVFWNEYKETNKIWFLGLSVFSVALVLLYGGRGCFFVFILYLCLNYITHREIRNWKNIVPILFVLLLLFLWAFGFLNSFLTKLSELASVLNSRTLEKLFSGEILDDNGRNNVWGMAIELIKNGGINGYGVYGDRMVIGQYYSWGYSHNIFLELLVSFGIWGGLIGIVLVVEIVRFFRKEQDKKWKNLFIIYLSLSCQLLVSDSFWYNSWFWGMLAVLYFRRKGFFVLPTTKKLRIRLRYGRAENIE